MLNKTNDLSMPVVILPNCSGIDTPAQTLCSHPACVMSEISGCFLGERAGGAGKRSAGTWSVINYWRSGLPRPACGLCL